MKPFSAALDSARRSTCRGSAQDGEPSGSRMSQNIRALSPLTAALEREHLERRRVGHGDHVGLVDPGEALDRRAVEADALLERRLQLGRRDRDALQGAEHVGEPQPDEADVPLLERTEHELLLTVHVVTPRCGRPDRPVFPGPVTPSYADHARHRCAGHATQAAPAGEQWRHAHAAARAGPGRTRPSATSPATPRWCAAGPARPPTPAPSSWCSRR